MVGMPGWDHHNYNDHLIANLYHLDLNLQDPRLVWMQWSYNHHICHIISKRNSSTSCHRNTYNIRPFSHLVALSPSELVWPLPEYNITNKFIEFASGAAPLFNTGMVLGMSWPAKTWKYWCCNLIFASIYYKAHTDETNVFRFMRTQSLFRLDLSQPKSWLYLSVE
jgi:hypothetical protein